MRALLFLLPVALMGQTPAPTTKAPAAKAPAASTAKAPATGAATAPKAAPKPAGAAAPGAARPAGTARPVAAKAAAGVPAALTTDEQKTIYAIGLSIYKSLAAFECSPEELELVKRAISDAKANKAAVPLEEWGPKIQALASERAKTVAVRAKAEGSAYLVKAAAEAGAVKTESGLIYQEMRAGDGASPKASDTVKVNYRGTLVDGSEFDSSYKRGQPAEFQLSGVIRCWTEGVQKMKVGGKAQLVCPSDLAYGEQGSHSIPGGSTLIFEIELLEIPGGK